MGVAKQVITDRYAVYHGDCLEVVPTLPDESVGLSVYSPPFADLYNYSSSDRDMSNCRTYDEFFEHYEFLVKHIKRLTLPGRMTVVHCMDLKDGSGGGLRDFPGDIIRLHQRNGFLFHSRHCVWKEPLKVAIRTRAQGLMHKQIVKDSSLCRVALPDYVLAFRRKGKNPVPIAHPLGITEYHGEREPPPSLVKKYYKGWNNPKTNKLSHWIWQKYASSVWDDVRNDHVLRYKEAKGQDDEKHICPLQLDVIERCVELWSTKDDVVLTPFMGVGSEVYVAVRNGRRGVGVELKASYFRQALKNLGTLKRRN